MKHTFLFISLFFFAFSSCHKKTTSLDIKSEQQISDTLKSIAVRFLQSWEPPFDENKSLESFTHKEDFCLVIDGLYISNYNRWASAVPESMENERLHYKEYSHKIHDIRTTVLSVNSGVVTIVYTWNYVTDEDEHNSVEGAITFVCRLEENGWKIVQYHGSHSD